MSVNNGCTWRKWLFTVRSNLADAVPSNSYGHALLVDASAHIDDARIRERNRDRSTRRVDVYDRDRADEQDDGDPAPPLANLC